MPIFYMKVYESQGLEAVILLIAKTVLPPSSRLPIYKRRTETDQIVDPLSTFRNQPIYLARHSCHNKQLEGISLILPRKNLPPYETNAKGSTPLI